MEKEDIVQKILNALQEKKEPFFDKLRDSIRVYVSSKSTSECLELVTRQKDDTILAHWTGSDGLNYVKRLIAFCRKKDFDGYQIDSGLTDGIVKLVTDELSSFYQDNSEAISKYLLQAMLQDKKASTAFFDTLFDSTIVRYISNEAKHQAMILLLEAIDVNTDQIKEIMKQKVTTFATIIFAKAVASPIAKAIMTKAAYILAIHLKVLIPKLLAIPAIKSMIIIAIKKFVIAAVVASFIKLIVAKTGLSAGTAVAIILLPIVLGILAYEWLTFPEKLGRGIAEGVIAEWDKNFTETNKTIIEKLLEDFIGNEAENFGKSLADNEEIQEAIQQLLNLVNT